MRKGNCAKLLKDKESKNAYSLFINGEYIGKVFTNPKHICMLTGGKKITISVKSLKAPTQKSGDWYRFSEEE